MVLDKEKRQYALIKARIGKGKILEEATDMILQANFAKVLEEAKVEPIAQPALSIDKLDEEELQVKILVPVEPEVELGEYKGLEIKKTRVTVTKKEIEEQLANYQSQFAELSTKRRWKSC